MRQFAAHVRVNGETVLVLVRPSVGARGGQYTALKLRQSGRLGQLLADESAHLAGAPDTLARLRAGEVVKL